MCGEHRNIIACICVSLGSSPHVRGAQKHCRHRRGVPGIIPACAGSTIRFYPECGGNGDHPRMCGEHSLYQPRRHSGGIIPACAGSTGNAVEWRASSWDHPRMCGEHQFRVVEVRQVEGSSPHVRGARHGVSVASIVMGIIPACAGSTNVAFYSPDGLWDHPRMCGEHVQSVNSIPSKPGSSPHVRGALRHYQLCRAERGIIPACAGSTMAYRPS